MRCTPHTRTWPPMRTAYAQQLLMLAMCLFAEGRGASAWSTNTRAITKQNSPAHIRKRYRCAAENPSTAMWCRSGRHGDARGRTSCHSRLHVSFAESCFDSERECAVTSREALLGCWSSSGGSRRTATSMHSANSAASCDTTSLFRCDAVARRMRCDASRCQ